MIKKDDGFILIDTIISLLILTITLTSIYGLIIKSLNFEDIISTNLDIQIKESGEYDDCIKKITEQ